MAKKPAKTEEEAEETAAAKPEGVEGAEGAEGAPAGKKSKKKMIIIGALALLVLIGAGAGAYFGGFIGGKKDEHAEEGEKGEAGKDGKEGEHAAAPVFYTMPEFLINLNSSGKQSSFLKTTIILELDNPTDVPAVEANLPRLVDSVNTYMRELRPSDLAGSAGIQRLREELLLRAGKALAPIKINDVLFKEIIVQ